MAATLPSALTDAIDLSPICAANYTDFNREAWGEDDLAALHELCADVTRQELASIVAAVQGWRKGKSSKARNSDPEASLFTAMGDAGVCRKALCLVLTELMTGFPLLDNNRQVVGLHAAAAYTALLAQEDSPTFRLFDPLVFRAAVGALRKWLCAQRQLTAAAPTSGQKRGRSGASRPSKRARKAQATAGSQREEEGNEGVEDQDNSNPEGDEDSSQSHATVPPATLGDVEIAVGMLVDLAAAIGTHDVAAMGDVWGETVDALMAAAGMRSRHAKRALFEQASDIICRVVGECEGDEVGPLLTPCLRAVMPLLVSPSGGQRDDALALTRRLADPPHHHELMKALVHRLCMRAPDKTDVRRLVVAAVADIFVALPSDARSSLARFLCRLARNAKPTLRLTAVEVAQHVLQTSQASEGAYVTPACMHLLLTRASDKTPTVRSRAMSAIVQVLGWAAENPLELDRIVRCVTSEADAPLATTPTRGELPTTPSAPGRALDTPLSPLTSPLTSPRGSDHVGTVDVLSLLCRRMVDARAAVRKASLQVLEAMFAVNALGAVSEELFAAVARRCMDVAVSIRKQALGTLTLFLRELPASNAMVTAWVTGVLPMVMDVESSIVDKAVDAVFDTVVAPLVASSPSTSLVWAVVDRAYASDAASYLQRACTKLGQTKRIQARALKAVLECANNPIEVQDGVCVAPSTRWRLLECLVGAFLDAPQSPPPCPLSLDAVASEWRKVVAEDSKNSDNCVCAALRVLTVVGRHQRSDMVERVAALGSELATWVRTYSHSAEVTQAALDVLAVVCDKAHFEELCKQVMKECCEGVRAWVHALMDEGKSEVPPSLLAQIHTVGHMAIVADKVVEVPSRMITILQSLVQPTMHTAFPNSDESVVNSSFGSSLNGSAIAALPTPAVVRTHALVTLGKLCLVNPGLAKRCLPVFAWELNADQPPAVRNNLLVILHDCCKRYTSSADRYVPRMSACLFDESPVVRRHALLLLTRLLQENFIKFKGSLFVRYVAVLVDDDAEIRRLAKYCLLYMLSTRNPLLVHSHFVETLFGLNKRDSEHTEFNNKHPDFDVASFSQSQANSQPPSSASKQGPSQVVLKDGVGDTTPPFDLSGEANRDQRMEIYKTMLQCMTDEQKFNLTSKLCHDVLADFAEESLSLTSSSDILVDAIHILGSQDIKITLNKGRAADNDGEDAEEQSVARGKLLSQVVKKNAMENILPILIELKHTLEAKRSPLVRHLTLYLRDLLRDYRAELADMLAADKQLAMELEYDFNQLDVREREVEREKQRLSNRLPQPDDPPASPARSLPTTPTSKPAAAPSTPFSVPRLRNTPHTPSAAPVSSLAGPIPLPLQHSAHATPSKQWNVVSPVRIRRSSVAQQS